VKPDGSALSLFISYSHRDDELREKLDTHLSLLKRQGVFDVWHDRRIAAGQEWAGQIDAELESADIVLLLISADFLASDYCYDREMLHALQRHDAGSARVVPVILRPCDWQTSPFARLQVLPRDGTPVRSHADIDVALTEVARALRTVAEAMHTSRSSPPQTIVSPSAAQSSGAEASPPAPPLDSPAEPAPAPSPAPATKQLLKIDAIKVFGIFSVGPFELSWPPPLGRRRFLTLAVVCTLIVAGTAWALIARPQIEKTRDFMRRGDYPNALSTIDSAPRWIAALPAAVAVGEQARFGAKLASGTLIRDETPALAALRERYPAAPDVLLFLGLKALYVDAAPEQALNLFTQATQADPTHAEAHFLAAGQHLTLAYAATLSGDAARARLHASKAQAMAEVVAKTPAGDLPRYANQAAELREIDGDWPQALKIYARLASGHPLSALQASFVSWRMSDAAVEQRQALEQLGAAIMALAQAPKESLAQTAWLFRVSASEEIHVGAREDRLCLMRWADAISKSLLASTPDSSVADRAAPDDTRASPIPCTGASHPDSMREIVCVQALTAQQALPPADPRRAALAKWIESPLRCGAELEPLPNLAPSASGGPTT